MPRIGRYEVAAELGRGAMGIVYRAHDPKIGREVAVKTIRLKDVADANEIGTLRQRMVREAQSAGRLAHPGIVTIFDVDEEDGLAYITMEVVDGQPLSNVNVAEMSFERRIRYVDELLTNVSSALDYAHRRGVVHRDIKPSNIMLTRRGVKVMDFGVARISSSQLTRSGTFVGTPNYIAPEQVRAETVDGRADQFALAVIAYELLAGKKPFRASDIAATLFRVVNDTPESLRALNPAVGDAVERVVMRALSKDPDKRFDSCTAFAKAFGDAARMPAIRRGAAAGAAASHGDETADAQDIASDLTLGRPRRGAAVGKGRPTLPLPSAASADSVVVEPQRPPKWPIMVFLLLVAACIALAVVLVEARDVLGDRTIYEVIMGIAVPDPDPDSSAPAEADASPEPVEPVQPPAEPPTTAAAPEREFTLPPLERVDTPLLIPDAAIEGEPETPVAETPLSAGAVRSKVFFRTDIAGVLVEVDSNPDWRCRTPCPSMELPNGSHTVIATKRGYGLQRRTIQVASSPMSVELQMAASSATLIVASDPTGARIYINGLDTGQVTAGRVLVLPGTHQVRVVKGDLDATRSIVVSDGDTSHLRFRLGTQ